MKTFRAFGPTIGKSKLSKKIINTLNAHIDKFQLSKKNDYLVNSHEVKLFHLGLVL